MLLLFGCQETFDLSKLTKTDKIVLTRVYIDPVVYQNSERARYQDSIQLTYTLQTQEMAYMLGVVNQWVSDLSKRTPFECQSAFLYKDHAVYRQLPERAKFPGYLSLPPFKSIKIEQKAPRSLLLKGFDSVGLATLWITYAVEHKKKHFFTRKKIPYLMTTFKVDVMNNLGNSSSFSFVSSQVLSAEIPPVFSLTGAHRQVFIEGLKGVQKKTSELDLSPKK
ncbi:hypothetical protein DID77_02940 [Candidatus Marinamargulisbacteria bacterium SCGC AG-439-L15]|nr:hypothetical protein DID77_02940 [Candidatus Marinamargulisbacteria bacterium SCGC AG-439-L15]